LINSSEIFETFFILDNIRPDGRHVPPPEPGFISIHLIIFLNFKNPKKK